MRAEGELAECLFAQRGTEVQSTYTLEAARHTGTNQVALPHQLGSGSCQQQAECIPHSNSRSPSACAPLQLARPGSWWPSAQPPPSLLHRPTLTARLQPSDGHCRGLAIPLGRPVWYSHRQGSTLPPSPESAAALDTDIITYQCLLLLAAQLQMRG